MPDQPLVVDRASSAVRLSDQQVAEWAGDKRVFISSVMEGLREERRAVADAVRELGGDPVWFEEFGGRDQDPEQAYLSEVDSSHMYVGILGSRYGRQDRDTGSLQDAQSSRPASCTVLLTFPGEGDYSVSQSRHASKAAVAVPCCSVSTRVVGEEIWRRSRIDTAAFHHARSNPQVPKLRYCKTEKVNRIVSIVPGQKRPPALIPRLPGTSDSV